MRDGWVDASLGDVADITIGRTPPRDDPRYWTEDLTRPFCTIADMDGSIVRPRREGVTREAEADGKAKRMPAGSLLLSFKLTIGRVGIAGVDLFPNEAIARVEPVTASLDKGYLALWLSSTDLLKGAGRAVKGNTLNSTSLRAIPVSYPAPAEQRRIVDVVRALDHTLAAAGTAVKRLDALLLSLVEEWVFAQDYAWQTLETLALPRGLAGGPFGSDLTTSNFVPEGVPVLQGRNLTGAAPYISGPFKFVSPEKASTLTNNLAVPGDVVVTQRGTLGQVALLPRDGYQTYVVSQSQMRLRVDPARVSPEYAYLALSSPRLVAEVVSQKIATANPHINLGIFSRLSIPVPALAVQAEVVGIAFGILAQRHATRAVAHATARLRSAVIADLLSGEHEIPAAYDRLLDGAA